MATMVGSSRAGMRVEAGAGVAEPVRRTKAVAATATMEARGKTRLNDIDRIS
jgi:hypothetical protein